MTALFNSVAQVSSISSGLCDLLALEVHPLHRLLKVEYTGGTATPYLGYVEVNLQVPGIKGYNEDILFLVILTTTYCGKVPVVVRSKIIDQAMGMMTKWELTRATVIWKQVHFGVVMSGLLQLPHTDSKEDREVGKEVTPSPSSDLAASRGFCLDDAQGPVHTNQKVTISPFGTVSIHGDTGIWGSCMRVSTSPPVVCLCGTNCHLQGVAPGILLSSSLSKKHEYLPHRSPHQGHCWQGHSCQSGTASGPSNGDFRRVHPWPTEGMEPGSSESPGPQGVA